MLETLAVLFRWPGVFGLLLVACFALMSLLLWIEWRNARRDCNEQTGKHSPQGLGIVGRWHAQRS